MINATNKQNEPFITNVVRSERGEIEQDSSFCKLSKLIALTLTLSLRNIQCTWQAKLIISSTPDSLSSLMLFVKILKNGLAFSEES